MRVPEVRRESDVLAEVRAYLESLGAVVIRTNSGGMKIGDRYVRFNDRVGCSDLVCCLPTAGRAVFLAVETKRPGWTPTKAVAGRSLSKSSLARVKREAAQRAFLDDVTRAGGLAVFARSVDELKQALKAEGLI